ncbi:MAG: hypothetical protein HKN85_04350, partial [Gammaproteobacteria bacterium]|nr:hypothetical protein [Gammaproteobacteria bacterium]
MIKIIKLFGVFLVLFSGAGAVFVFSPSAQLWLMQQFAPDHPFTAGHATPAPNYAETANWLAHPDVADNADWAPAGFPAIKSDVANAYVFFIHPTAYLG